MRRLARTNFTLLLLREGLAEVELARVMRDFFLPRGCGTALSFENAHGSGGANALNIALKRQRESAYDAYGVLVDTDQNWSDEDRRRAREADIFCIENNPCLEATLLTVGGHRAHANTHHNKAQFERAYGAPPHREGVIARHFTAELFSAARADVIAIDQFLRFLRC
jgi:hypothetical protein